MIGENGRSLLMVPYNKRDFRSHYVSRNVYDGRNSMEISSMKLCRIIAFIHQWDLRKSYRAPGRIYTEEQIVLFNLDRAVTIKCLNKNSSSKIERNLEMEPEILEI